MPITSVSVILDFNVEVLHRVEGSKICRIELSHRVAIDPELEKRSIRVSRPPEMETPLGGCGASCG
jgi:hypothetical protein